MRYEARQPAEGINVSAEHPLKEFAQLLIGIAVVAVLTILALSYFAGAIAKRVPFSYEQSLLGDSAIFASEEGEQQKALQALADRIAAHMDLPEDMTITVHFSKDDTVNALATLGGNTIFFAGLVEAVDSEEELAAVMAHEIAHIKLRHPIVAAGKGLTIGLFVAFLSGASGSSAGKMLIGNTANLSMLQYTRTQEAQADALAAAALFAEYGHVQGAQKLFNTFEQLENQSAGSRYTPKLFRSHPYSIDRWEAIKAMATANSWPIQGTSTPLDF